MGTRAKIAAAACSLALLAGVVVGCGSSPQKADDGRTGGTPSTHVDKPGEQK
jgi:hypothetical protein